MSNIRDNGIRYPERVICAEDQNFNLKCICSSPQIYIYDDVVYNYDQTNINSASKKNIMIIGLKAVWLRLMIY